MSGQHTQQVIRSRNDAMHHEHVGITGCNSTQKRLADQPGNPGEPLPIDAKLHMCCNYRKLNSKLPADFWNYEKQGR